MTISTATALESNTAHSEFTAAPAISGEAARTILGSQVRTERAVTAKRRRVRVDWYALGVLLLILASGAVCIYRLVWAMQP